MSYDFTKKYIGYIIIYLVEHYYCILHAIFLASFINDDSP